ncbi:hypothetical protein [Demequina globuliformis]|uniref:hypothetical protein n=1 Tax=Demequina globuliformis TaxID=676202 RepID=UPI000783453A|nr:hypothetical protein [Demequina globuliformis]
MRAGAPTVIQAAAVGYRVRVDSYLGASTLAEDVRPSGGSYTFDTTREDIESATLAFPAVAAGRNWTPGSNTQAALANYGQELTLNAIMHLGDERWVTELARVVNAEWTDGGGDIEVQAHGVLGRVAEDRFSTPQVPRRGGTLASEFRRIMPAGIPVDIDPALVDRACPSSFEWPEDRLAALYDIADTWPALIVPDGFGGVRLIPDLPDTVTPTMTFTDGEGGTVVSAPRSDTRSGRYNHVIARAQSTESDAPLIQGEAFVTSGPFAVDGPYGRVTRFYTSPTLTSKSQCESAAASILKTSMRPARTVEATAAVDPRVEPYEPVEVIREGVRYLGYVIAGTFPTGPGDMRLTVSVVSESEV